MQPKFEVFNSKNKDLVQQSSFQKVWKIALLTTTWIGHEFSLHQIIFRHLSLASCKKTQHRSLPSLLMLRHDISTHQSREPQWPILLFCNKKSANPGGTKVEHKCNTNNPLKISTQPSRNVLEIFVRKKKFMQTFRINIIFRAQYGYADPVDGSSLDTIQDFFSNFRIKWQLN